MRETLQLATPECPVTREEVYIHGTEPTEFCTLHGGHVASDAPPGLMAFCACSAVTNRRVRNLRSLFPPGAAGKTPGSPASAQTQPETDENKKGVLRRIFGIFGGKKDADKPPQETPEPTR